MEQLLRLTSTQLVVSMKAKSFHWNGVGPHFFSLHNFYEKVYNTLDAHADDLAERMRALKALAPTSPKMVLANSAVSTDDIENSGESDMARALRHDLDTLHQLSKSVVKQAETDDDHETADMVTAFMTEYAKFIWMLDSFLSK